MFEDEVRRILTDNRLRTVKAMLEKDHAIDCLFLLLLDKGRWKHAKEFMSDLELTKSDNLFRARMLELEANGLAKSKHIDAQKRTWEKTERGEKLANLLLEVFRKLQEDLALLGVCYLRKK